MIDSVVLPRSSSEKPLVSFISFTFNHEIYLKECLDGFLKQKDCSPIEIIIHDDASTDRTPEILKMYHEKYPSIFHIILENQNRYSQNKPIVAPLLELAQGDYIAFCEGDDFWIDENKIHEQIQFLQSHKEYVAVAHNCMVIDAESHKKDESYPECKENEYTFRHYRNNILPGQTATIVMRNLFANKTIDYTVLYNGLMPQDRVIDFILLCHGKIYSIQKTMSAYRHVTSFGSSFSATRSSNHENKLKLLFSLVQYAEDCFNKEALSCVETLYIKEIIHFLIHRKITLRNAFRHLRRIKHYCYPLALILNDYTQSHFFNKP